MARPCLTNTSVPYTDNREVRVNPVTLPQVASFNCNARPSYVWGYRSAIPLVPRSTLLWKNISTDFLRVVSRALDGVRRLYSLAT